MIPDLFILNAANILGDTNTGLTSSQIVNLCSAYAIDFNVDIPTPPYHSLLMVVFRIKELHLRRI